MRGYVGVQDLFFPQCHPAGATGGSINNEAEIKVMLEVQSQLADYKPLE